MLVKYGRDKKHRLCKKIKIYTREDHGIHRGRIPSEVLRIIEKLRQAGHEAYVVGGAVRDFLTGKTPKDFDVATSARPEEVRKVFKRNCRIIGRRFRLAHVYPSFRRYREFIEVSTFRAGLIPGIENQNEFGSLEDDAFRRDFTLNGLYYSPREEQIIDYVDGVEDIRKRTLRNIIPLKNIFKDDPVRILRGVKYASMGNMKIPLVLRNVMKHQTSLLKTCSLSRLGEEVFKILDSGYSSEIFKNFFSFKILRQVLPHFHNFLKDRPSEAEGFFRDLAEEDERVSVRPEKDRAAVFAAVSRRILEKGSPEGAGVFKEKSRDIFAVVFKALKNLFSPVTLPKKETEDAVSLLLKEKKIPFRRVSRLRKRRPRQDHAHAHHPHPHPRGSDRVSREGKPSPQSPGTSSREPHRNRKTDKKRKTELRETVLS